MLHVPLTLDVTSQWLDHIWLMAGKSITVTAHLHLLTSCYQTNGSVNPVQCSASYT